MARAEILLKKCMRTSLVVQGLRICLPMLETRVYSLVREPRSHMWVHASVVSHEQTFYTPMDCNLPGSSAFGISQIQVWEIPEDPLPGDLPNPGIEPVSPASPALAGGFFYP